MTRLSSKEILTLLLFLPGSSQTPGEPITGRTRLVHTLFLLAQEMQPLLRKQGVDMALPIFEASDSGPFSIQVVQDLNTLQTLDILRTETLPLSEELDTLDDLNYQRYHSGTAGIVNRQSMERYRITEDRGIGFCTTVLLPQFQPKSLGLLNQFKVRCNGTSLITLLRYVMTRYPQYTQNHHIKERVIRFDTFYPRVNPRMIKRYPFQ